MEFIVPVFIGAVIGYITNWLAIRMLFRPYKEKRILGVRLPFTPGLIPKEMARIAKSIGEAVGVHLLSPEVLSEALFSERVKKYVNEWIDDNKNNFCKSGKSIKELAADILGESYDKTIAYIETMIFKFIYSRIKDDEFKSKLKSMAGEFLFGSLDGKDLKDGTGKSVCNIDLPEDLKAEFAKMLNNDMDKLESDERSLNEAIPETVINAIKEYIIKNDKKIVGVFKKVLDSPVIKLRIKNLIADMVSQSTSKIVALFLNPESVADKFFESIQKYVDDSKNSKSIILILTTSLDKLLQSKVCDIVSSIPQDDRTEAISNMTQKISKRVLSEDACGKLFDLILERVDSAIESKMVQDRISSMIHDIIENILNRPASSIFENIGDDKNFILVDAFKNIFDNFIKSKLPDFIKLLDIPEIVEHQINSFDVVFAEEIIIEIADKELKAITWMGALLGGLIGILTPIMQLLF